MRALLLIAPNSVLKAVYLPTALPILAGAKAVDALFLRKFLVVRGAVGNATPRFEANKGRIFGGPNAKKWKVLKAKMQAMRASGAGQGNAIALQVFQHNSVVEKKIWAKAKPTRRCGYNRSVGAN